MCTRSVVILSLSCLEADQNIILNIENGHYIQPNADKDKVGISETCGIPVECSSTFTDLIKGRIRNAIHKLTKLLANR